MGWADNEDYEVSRVVQPTLSPVGGTLDPTYWEPETPGEIIVVGGEARVANPDPATPYAYWKVLADALSIQETENFRMSCSIRKSPHVVGTGHVIGLMLWTSAFANRASIDTHWDSGNVDGHPSWLRLSGQSGVTEIEYDLYTMEEYHRVGLLKLGTRMWAFLKTSSTVAPEGPEADEDMTEMFEGSNKQFLDGPGYVGIWVSEVSFNYPVNYSSISNIYLEVLRYIGTPTVPRPTLVTPEMTVSPSWGLPVEGVDELTYTPNTLTNDWQDTAAYHRYKTFRGLSDTLTHVRPWA